MYNTEEFEIIHATKKGFKAIISLSGDSGSGKTYSALRIARGLVGPKGKIGFIDTEERSGMYSDCFGGFNTINLYSASKPVEKPFSPERFGGAVEKFKKEGYNCVIIDSMSNEWEGDGGILDIADNQTYKSGKKREDKGKWIEPKRRHKRLMDYLLRCGMHIILCNRVKYPLTPILNEAGKEIGEERGEETVIRESTVNYDVTVDVILDRETKSPKKLLKCPEALEYMFPKGKQITEETGKMVIEWLESQQRDKDAIIKEGIEAKDLKSWAKSLPEPELYLARKYWKVIDGERNKKPQEKIVDVEL